MSRYTPGPWTYDGSIVQEKTRLRLASLYGVHDEDGRDETHGNGCLIAAAPKLCEHLGKIVGELYAMRPVPDAMVQEALAVLVEAKGGVGSRQPR